MPSKTPKQAKFMRAIAHGWTPSRMKSPPSRAVAQEFVDADRKYSGGFAENRYWVGGLAAMDQVNAGLKGSLDTPFQAFEEGGYTEAELLGSARGGHVNYYQEGGAARPGHAEGPNPFEGKGKPAQYNLWESENHIDPPPPPEVAEEVAEEGGVASWLRSLFTPDPGTAIGSGEARGTIEEQMEGMEQAYGGRVGYQAGGLAVAAPGRILPPAGGVPPWIEPVGSGPSFMEEEVPGYQFGGMATGMAGPMRMARQMRGRRGGGGRGGQMPRGGVMGGRAGQRPGGLAAMMQQRGGLHPGAQGPGGGFLSRFRQQTPGQPLHPGAQGPGGGGFMSRLRQMVQQQRAQQPGGPRVSELPGGPFENIGADYRRARGQQTYQDVVNRGEGGINPRLPGGGRMYGGGGDGGVAPGMVGTLGGPGYGQYPLGSAGPRMDPSDPRYRAAPPPGSTFAPGGGGGGKPRPGPGMMPEGGGIIGGPRVPPNMQGYLQKMRMKNRPPTGPGGGGGNRVGMADQQGAMARAMQRGTGRAPMSRRMGFGRAGRRR